MKKRRRMRVERKALSGIYYNQPNTFKYFQRLIIFRHLLSHCKEYLKHEAAPDATAKVAERYKHPDAFEVQEKKGMQK
jgi:hypothetical protein